MINLLINNSKLDNSLNETSFGGLPVKNVDSAFNWPRCKTCNSEMQYQGKINTDLGLELIFMCNADPGMCNEWDANLGGNKVFIIIKENLEFVKPLNVELALRPTEHGGIIREIKDYENYELAREHYAKEKGISPREILGQVFGEPSWIQADETPNCDTCGTKMRFVCQLEQGPDWKTEMNFGGGCGYLFDCPDCKTGKFLWQQ